MAEPISRFEPFASLSDHERFMRLFVAHDPQIFRAVLVFVPQQADARDIVQETAVALWQHFSDYDPSRPFINWACGYARIEVKRFLRKAQRRTMLSDKAVETLMAEGEDGPGFFEERERYLDGCKAKLSSEHRHMLNGYYMGNEDVETLARRHGRSVEAIYKTLQRIRQALLECIERKLMEARL
jgi:RNA polymerase sigma-70 factor (ECF subfamily)